jgi:hypothetical protein
MWTTRFDGRAPWERRVGSDSWSSRSLWVGCTAPVVSGPLRAMGWGWSIACPCNPSRARPGRVCCRRVLSSASRISASLDPCPPLGDRWRLHSRGERTSLGLGRLGDSGSWAGALVVQSGLPHRFRRAAPAVRGAHDRWHSGMGLPSCVRERNPMRRRGWRHLISANPQTGVRRHARPLGMRLLSPCRTHAGAGMPAVIFAKGLRLLLGG